MVRGGRRADQLTAAELDELVRLYLRTSSHLSTVRTSYRDPALTIELTRLVARANGVVYGAPARTLEALRTFVVVTFPAAVWHARRPIAASAGVFLAVFVAMLLWLANSPAAYDAVAPPEVRDAYVEEDFAAYYSSAPAAEFAASVLTNNIRVAIYAFALGIAACVPTAVVLAINGANLGLAAGLFTVAGRSPQFWGLILPHGLLELTAVFVAGGAGILLGWTLIAPGDRRRAEALAAEGRRAIVIVIGLVGVFVTAGLLEGFITPSGLPTAVRVLIGAVVEIAFLTYVVVLGRAAAAEGLTGALGEVTTSPRP